MILLLTGLIVTIVSIALGVYFQIAADNFLVALLFYILSLIALILSIIKFLIIRIEHVRCPLCGSDKSIHFSTHGRLAMVRCDDCGLLYASPRRASPGRFFIMQLWSFKDARLDERLRKIFSDDNRRINIDPKLEILRSKGYAGDGLSLVDVGCGIGGFASVAAEAGYKVTGIEPGWFSSRYARRRFDFEVINANLYKYVTDKKYDVVTSLHVIEHVHDPVGFGRALGRLVKKDGIVLVATPNAGCEIAISQGANWKAVGPDDHIVLFDEKTLEKTLRDAGFSKVDVFPFREDGDELIAVCHLT